MDSGPVNGATVQHAKQELMAGHAGNAIQELHTVLLQDGSNAEAYELMGAALSMAGRQEEGLVCLERAVVLQPDRATYHFNLGCALEQRGELMRAIEQFRLAAKADPNYTKATEAVRRVEIALLMPNGHTFAEH